MSIEEEMQATLARVFQQFLEITSQVAGAKGDGEDVLAFLDSSIAAAKGSRTHALQALGTVRYTIEELRTISDRLEIMQAQGYMEALKERLEQYVNGVANLISELEKRRNVYQELFYQRKLVEAEPGLKAAFELVREYAQRNGYHLYP